MKRIDKFIVDVRQSRENLREAILEYLKWVRDTKQLIAEKQEDLRSRLASNNKKRKQAGKEKLTKLVDFLKTSEENLGRIEDSITRSIYLFKHCVV